MVTSVKKGRRSSNVGIGVKRHKVLYIKYVADLFCGPVAKNPPTNAGDLDWILGPG